MITLSFATIFDINQRKVRIQDTSNYASQGILLTNVTGVIKVTSPRGVIYNNTNYSSPDVNQDVSLFSGYIALPHNKQGYILAGTYTIQYSVKNSVDNSISTQSNTYTYSFVVPQITINQVIDGYNSLFSSVDTTDYGSYASLTRVHTVTPPSGSPLLAVSNGNQTISYSPNIWSGNWKSEITTTLAYTVGGLVINAVLTDTQTTTAYNNDMNVIRGYIETFKLLYETARATDKNKAYEIQAALLKINTAYSEYDLALFYNDLATAYLRTVDIINELNDYITITFPEQIVPFVNSTGGSSHAPVSIAAPNYGVSINTSQVLSFLLASTGHGGMMPILSSNATDYLGGDGAWHSLSSGTYALKSDFTAYDSVRAITAADITNWNTAFGWGNHASAGYAVATNYYTKVNLQTSGQASVHWENISPKPTTIFGYGITDAMVANSPITGATHTKLSYDSKGLVTGGVDLSASDIPSLAWSKITSGTPTTLAGYGIIDAYTKTQVDNHVWAWTSITSGTPTTLSGYSITDAYTKAQVDAKTWDFTTNITGKPTTLAGYGITDGLSTSSPAASVINSGLGNLYLNDAGTYTVPLINGASDTQVIFIDGTGTAGNSNLTFDKTTNTLSVLNATIGTGLINTQLNFTDSTVNLSRTSGDLVFTDTHYSKTLSQLVSGATNFWTATGNDIYYYNTGTDKVGINTITPSAELEVVGHIVATDFDSNYFRYKNSNLLLGPNAGDLETGSGFLYIAASNTSTPLIKGIFPNTSLEFNADVYIQGSKTLNFGNANVRTYWGASDNLTFQDSVANSGNPVTLTSLIDGTFNLGIAGWTDLAAVKSITAANKTTWNKASILVTSGSATSFLAADGAYHTVSGGGVAPTDNFAKWDTGSNYYRFYSSKTEAGGVSSGGKFYLGTDIPTNTNRLTYDGIFGSYGYNSYETTGQAISGYVTSGVAQYGYATTGTAVRGDVTNGLAVYGLSTGTGVAARFQTVSTTPNIAEFISNSITSCVINSTGVNLVTGATYKVNGVDILSTKENALGNPGTNGYVLSSTTGGTRSWIANGATPVDGILHWDGATSNYKPYSSTTTNSFYLGTGNPSSSTRLNLDYGLYVTSLNSITTITAGNVASSGNTITGYSSNSGAAIRGISNGYSIGVSGESRNGYAGYFTNNSTSTGNTGNSIIFIERKGVLPSNGTPWDVAIIDILDAPTYSGGVASGSTLRATIDSTVRIDMNPRVADSGTNIAYLFDTHNSLSGTTKLFSFKNQTSEKFYGNNIGSFYADNLISAGFSTTNGQIGSGWLNLTASGTIRTNLAPTVSDGASAIAYKLDTSNNLSATGAKLFWVGNNGTEKFYIDKDGEAYANGVHLGAVGGGSMIYPGAGIPNSTGSAWGTSYTTTGSGTVIALATGASLTTPTLGVASATSINKVAITAPATSATLTILNGKTLTVNNTLAFSGTDSSTLNIGTGGTLGTGAYATIANYAPLVSPALTGTPTVPTAATGTNTTQAASTAYVKAEIVATTPATIDISTILTNTALTGIPTAPTASVGTNTTQLATTAFVLANGGNGLFAGPILINQSTQLSTGTQLEMTGVNGIRFNVQAPTSISDGRIFNSLIPSEANSRMLMYSTGTIGIGPGTATRDIFFGRKSSGTLGVFGAYDGTGNGNLDVAGIITQQGIYAEIYVADGVVVQSIPTGTTYTKITAFTTNGESSNCTANAANDKITITKAGKYKITSSFSTSVGTNGVTFRTAVFVGGTEVNKIHTSRIFTNSNNMSAASATGIVNVAANTDVDVRCYHDSGSSVNITVLYANLNVEYLGE